MGLTVNVDMYSVNYFEITVSWTEEMCLTHHNLWCQNVRHFSRLCAPWTTKRGWGKNEKWFSRLYHSCQTRASFFPAKSRNYLCEFSASFCFVHFRVTSKKPWIVLPSTRTQMFKIFCLVGVLARDHIFLSVQLWAEFFLFSTFRYIFFRPTFKFTVPSPKQLKS